MNIILILVLILVLPLIAFIAFLVLSSCLGDRLRARLRHASFGRTYARSIWSGAGQAGWEQIEMEDRLNEGFDGEEERTDDGQWETRDDQPFQVGRWEEEEWEERYDGVTPMPRSR